MRIGLVSSSLFALLGLLGCSSSDGASGRKAPDSLDTPVEISSLPFEQTIDVTTLGASRYSSYPCAPSFDASGPEVVHRVVVAEAGLLTADVDDGAVFVLGSNDPNDCVSGGRSRAALFVEPGEYFVSIETSAPTARVSIAHTTPSFLAAAAMNPDVAKRGLQVFGKAWQRADTDRLEFSLIDFSVRSDQRREWIVDLRKSALLWNLYVAHGWGSADPNDPARAVVFSNVPESHQSSLGLLRTGEPYIGDYGQSYRLDGLEPGYNDNVRSRDIVVHPWEESRPDYVAANGMTGPTWGCPAIDDQLAPEVVQKLASGALMWFWFSDGDWSEASTYFE